VPNVVQRVTCKECGFVLYEGTRIRTHQEVAAGVGGGCPSCGRELEYGPGTFKAGKVAIALKVRDG
jgi:RNase P subunit RPR2